MIDEITKSRANAAPTSPLYENTMRDINLRMTKQELADLAVAIDACASKREALRMPKADLRALVGSVYSSKVRSLT